MGISPMKRRVLKRCAEQFSTALFEQTETAYDHRNGRSRCGGRGRIAYADGVTE